MSNDDVLFRFRLRVIALAKELGSVREACRVMEVHPSSFYRWRQLLERYGPDILRPRERRQPQMPNAISHRSARAGAPAPAPGAAPRRRPPRRTDSDGLLLHWPADRDQGHGRAVHGHPRPLRLHAGPSSGSPTRTPRRV